MMDRAYQRQTYGFDIPRGNGLHDEDNSRWSVVADDPGRTFTSNRNGCTTIDTTRTIGRLMQKLARYRQFLHQPISAERIAPSGKVSPPDRAVPFGAQSEPQGARPRSAPSEPFRSVRPKPPDQVRMRRLLSCSLPTQRPR